MIETLRFGNVSWSHIIRPNEEDLQALKDHYQFHDLDIEDCRTLVTLRPKIDIYDDYLFMILHFPTFDSSQTFVDIREIKIFWGRDYLITIGKSHWLFKEMFNQEKNRSITGYSLEVASSDALLYRILDFVMEDSQKVVEKVDQDVDQCGKSLFAKHADKLIEKISVTRKNVILLNTMFRPQLLLFNKLQSGAIKGFAEDMEDYWGDILDIYQKIWDMVEDQGELIKGYSTTFDSLLVNKTNEVIKILTLISSILLPLTFIASMYGMNIKLPVQDHPYSFYIVAGSMAGIAVMMVVYFRIKKWM
jgi:magnesium transporter